MQYATLPAHMHTTHDTHRARAERQTRRNNLRARLRDAQRVWRTVAADAAEIPDDTCNAADAILCALGACKRG
jgi:hypothetical protein